MGCASYTEDGEISGSFTSFPEPSDRRLATAPNREDPALAIGVMFVVVQLSMILSFVTIGLMLGVIRGVALSVGDASVMTSLSLSFPDVFGQSLCLPPAPRNLSTFASAALLRE